MAIDAGRFRHEVIIEYFDYARDSDGEVIQDPGTGETEQNWYQFSRVYAAIEPMKAKDFIAAQAQQSEISANIILRFIDGLRLDMRFRHVRGGSLSDVIYEPRGFLNDMNSGIEYIVIPVKRIELP